MKTEIDTSTTAGKIAVMQAFVYGKEIESRALPSGSWSKNFDPTWCWQLRDYRIAPESKTRPLRASDWDGLPVVWVRFTNDKSTNWFVTCVSDKGFTCQGMIVSWGKPETENKEWSTDRKTWNPFTVEETQ